VPLASRWTLSGAGVILEGAAEMMLRATVSATTSRGTIRLDAGGAGARMERGSTTCRDRETGAVAREYMASPLSRALSFQGANLRVCAPRALRRRAAKVRRVGDADLPFTATLIPPPDAPLNTVIESLLNMQANTCSFDVSGHHAFTVAMRRVNGLPVGLMLVGRHFENTLIRLARAIEAGGDGS